MTTVVLDRLVRTCDVEDCTGTPTWLATVIDERGEGCDLFGRRYLRGDQLELCHRHASEIARPA